MRKRKNPIAWFQQALKVAEDPAASGWLKNALIEAINRDPVDAAGDAEVLSRILQQRAAAIQMDPDFAPRDRMDNAPQRAATAESLAPALRRAIRSPEG